MNNRLYLIDLDAGHKELGPEHYGATIEAFINDQVLVPVEADATVSLCTLHYRPKIRKHMRHCEGVWTENMEYEGDYECVVEDFMLLRQGGDV